MLTPEEIEERRHFVGASDAAAIVGVNPYSSAWDVYAEKTGVPIDRSAMEERFWWGSELEAVVARRFELVTAKPVMCAPPVIHPAHPWLRASPDRLLVGEPAGLEIKTVSTWEERLWGAEGTDEVPPHVRIQCEVGMACTGLDLWHVAMLGGSFTMKTYIVRRPAGDYERMLIKALGKFWHEHVLARVEPPMDGSDGARAWLQAMYPRDTREVRAAETPEELDAIEAFIAAKRIETQAKATISAAKNNLARLIGDAGGLTCSKGLITYRADKRGRRSFKSKLEGAEEDA
ncbi:MAG TPA: YqaJ viral recombinase family protein [Vulgatibacter sp.]